MGLSKRESTQEICQTNWLDKILTEVRHVAMRYIAVF